MAANEDQKREYLDEHLPYMLASIRYNFQKMKQPQYFRDWNAYFESFAVNARNLAQFLDNSDTGNSRACDIVKDFKFRKEDIQGPLAKLSHQVFHLGKSRPRAAADKFDLSHAEQVLRRIESGIERFVGSLSDTDKKLWNADKADPAKDIPETCALGPTAPSSSASLLVMSNSTTSTSGFQIVSFNEDKPD